MTSKFLNRPGAVESAEPVDAGIAAHYGNAFSEQRALAAGTAIVDLSHRAVIAVSGSDRRSWIDSLSSQSVANLTPGESTETLLLNMTGRIDYAVRLFDDGTELWLLLEREQASGLLLWLASMKFALRVELTDRSLEFATIGSLGRPELPVAAPTGLPLIWHDPWMGVRPGGYQYAVATRHPAAGWTYSETLVPRAALGGIVGSDIPAAGLHALEALRVAAWRPRFSTEVDDKSIPHELDWLRTAGHLNKGGYRGQQTVAKVHNVGHPPRRLVMLYLDGFEGVLSSRGDRVMAPHGVGQNGVGQGSLADPLKNVGLVTSVARHYELGPVALAVIKRGTDSAGDLLVRTRIGDVPARQVVIVPPDAGAVAAVTLPRLARPAA